MPYMDIYSLNNFFLDLRKKFDEKYKDLYYKCLAEYSVYIMDKWDIFCEHEKESFKISSFSNELVVKRQKDDLSSGIIYFSHSMIKESCIESKLKMVKSGFDFSCNVTVHPCENYILLMIFCDNVEYEKFFMSLNSIEYYGYWNNTDPPDDISNEEFEKRKKDWQSVLGENFELSPNQNGFLVDLVNYSCIGALYPDFPYQCMLDEKEKSKFLEFIPSFEKRFKNVLNQAIDRCLDKKKVKISEYIEEKKRFKKDKGFKKFEKDLRFEFQKKAHKDISFEDLLKKEVFHRK